MNILLIRLSALGDIVIMTSALEYLKDKGKVTLITKRKYFELFIQDNRIERLLDESDLKAIGNEPFDLACDLHAKPKTLSMLFKVKARKKCMFNKRPVQRRLAVWFKKRIKEVPLYKLYVTPLQKYFDDTTYPLPSLKLPFFKVEGLPDRYIAVFPGASQRQKMWPLEYFLKVSSSIFEKYHIPSVYMGAEEMELPQKPYIINRIGMKPLSYIVNAIKYSQLVLSNDSGPAHIAAAVNTPLFVIFGPTIPEFGFRPVSKAPVFLFERKDLKCRPCSLHGEKKCKYGDLRCLRGIMPEEILNKIDGLLK